MSNEVTQILKATRTGKSLHTPQTIWVPYATEFTGFSNNDIKNEIQNSVDVESPTKKITQDFKEEVDKVKKDFDDLGDSIKREL